MKQQGAWFRWITNAMVVLFVSQVGTPSRASQDEEMRPAQLIETLTQLFDGIRPEQHLYQVFEEIVWRWQSGDHTGEFLARKKAQLRRLISHPEQGTEVQNQVRRLLFERGFNWYVFHYLLVFIQSEHFDTALIYSSVVGRQSAGIPPYAVIQKDSGFQVDFGNQLVIAYDPEIYNLLLEVNSYLDEVVQRSPRSDRRASWIVHRARRVRAIIEAFERIEALLNQAQGLLATLEMKRSQYAEAHPEKAMQLAELKAKTETENSELFSRLRQLIERAQAMRAGRPYSWRSMDQMMRQSSLNARSLQVEFEERGRRVLSLIDEIEGTKSAENRYENDTPYELTLAREQQLQDLAQLRQQWDEVKNFTYYKRDDKWLYTHDKKTSQGGAFSEIERAIRSKAVNFTRIPPILEETDVVERLIEVGRMSFEDRLSVQVIDELIEQVRQSQISHDRHQSGGPIQSHDTQSHFDQRNTVIAQLHLFANEALHRQQAEALMGYIGVSFAEDQAKKYHDIIRLLERKNLITRALQAGAAAASSGGGYATVACWDLISPALDGALNALPWLQ